MKSAKRLNRKLVKSRLTKKRRQVGSGKKNYTIKYNKYNASANKNIEYSFDIIVNIDESYVESKNDSILVMEKGLPTLAQFITYATNFLPGKLQEQNPNTGLFITKENDSQNIDFYKLNNKEIKKILKDGNTIDIGVIGVDLSINGVYITHLSNGENEPTLIPEGNLTKKKFSRAKTLAKKGRSGTPNSNRNNTLPLPIITANNNAPPPIINFNNVPISGQIAKPSLDPHAPPPPPPRRTSGAASDVAKNVALAGLYSIVKPKNERAPALPPRKAALPPYTGKGTGQFTK
jgi:hypothetical protein